MNAPAASKNNRPANTQLATLGGGCFWCLDAVFRTVPGVKTVTCGYSGGQTDNPTYEQVCTKTTGHAEVVQIEFDPAQVSYEKLLELFWKIHDPTTRNRQGADVGPQYRSVIFHHNEAQRLAAEKSKQQAQKRFAAPIVTEIAPLTKFWPAEDYHQDYFRKNPTAGYCRLVIQPKLDKLKAR
ncbi:MAG: peptide-methionine (S)-S-oxide reductase MsrA [Verrucomicrobiae bacterium]|nr:peptide-methionine (S)-S-oxide reductase MsrA [Verrucomicrobiae bacterium]